MELVRNRVENHEMRNAARKLTPLERKVKKMKKAKEDMSEGIWVGLFRVKDLSDAQQQYIIDMNAQWNGLTGGVLKCFSVEDHFERLFEVRQKIVSGTMPSEMLKKQRPHTFSGSIYGAGEAAPPAPSHLFGPQSVLGPGGMVGTAGATSGLALVVVEGGNKALKRFMKLMMRRIKWSGDDEHTDGESNSHMTSCQHRYVDNTRGLKYEGSAMIPHDEIQSRLRLVETAGGVSKEGNFCDLVWVGTVAKRSFSTFKFQSVKSARAARKVMGMKGVAHYWDMVIRGDKVDAIYAI